jgi:Mg2+ and Co2+ transporter CorA
MATALLFDRDRVDDVDDWTMPPRIGRSAILWIDLERPTDDDVDRLIEMFDLVRETQQELAQRNGAPAFADHGEYVHVGAIGLSDPRARATTRVDCLVSERWLVTVHDGPVEFVDRFRELAEGSGAVGRLDGLGFLANLLEWTLASYLDAFEVLEQDLEEIDAKAMSSTVAITDEVLSALVDMRREVGRLRRALVSHRDVVLALTRPELEAIASSDSARRFSSLRDRLEEAVQASRDTRESIVGSFDVLLASTGQRTNEIMKVLTLASVLILPGALIAGVMGMNFKVGIFENAAYFWVVLVGILGVAVVTVGLARAREWI